MNVVWHLYFFSPPCIRWLVFNNRKLVIKGAIIFVSFELMNLLMISTAELVAVNSIAVQYDRPTDSVSLITD